MRFEFVLHFAGFTVTTAAITHPGLLHTEADFTRIKSLVNSGKEPFKTGWQKVVARANKGWKPRVTDNICRGRTDACTQNYGRFYGDIHAAYANALYWKVTGDTAHAQAAVDILNAWSSKAPPIMGSSDRFLAAGIYGYQYANVAEILRGYSGWKGLDSTVAYLRDTFYPMSHSFLTKHNDAKIDHYWANWDLCSMAAVHAIGVLSDNQTMVDEAVNYFKAGAGNGAIDKVVWKIHQERGSNKPLGQGQEAGRDQGHSILDFALLGVLAQQSYNQGEDLFEYQDNRILAGAEYAFKYNSGKDVPYTAYTNSDVTQAAISPTSRGNKKPIAELLYAHYFVVKKLNASWTETYRDIVTAAGGGAEGGGGDYGDGSGGYDQLGFGTILFRRE